MKAGVHQRSPSRHPAKVVEVNKNNTQHLVKQHFVILCVQGGRAIVV